MASSIRNCLRPNIKRLLSRSHAKGRFGSVSASEAAAFLSLSPHESRENAIIQKLGKTNVPSRSRDTKGMHHGNMCEKDALAKYVRLMEREVIQVGYVVHEKYDFLGCAPDGVTTQGEVIEIKCPYTRPIIPCHIPAYYIPQLQLEMEILDLPVLHYLEYKPGKDRFDDRFQIIPVERDRAWFESHLDELYHAHVEIKTRKASRGH